MLESMNVTLSIFFFQAEDGIRDTSVTGVQTCALPISRGHTVIVATPPGHGARIATAGVEHITLPLRRAWDPRGEIGRASCRERVEISVGAAASKRKTRILLTRCTATGSDVVLCAKLDE